MLLANEWLSGLTIQHNWWPSWSHIFLLLPVVAAVFIINVNINDIRLVRQIIRDHTTHESQHCGRVGDDKICLGHDWSVRPSDIDVLRLSQLVRFIVRDVGNETRILSIKHQVTKYPVLQTPESSQMPKYLWMFTLQIRACEHNVRGTKKGAERPKLG